MSDRFITTLLCLLFAPFAALAEQPPAEIPLAEFLEVTGVRAGDTALRDLRGWQPPRKILVHGGWYLDTDLQSQVSDVEVVRAADRAAALQEAADADAIIGSCDNELVNAAPRLKWVQISGAGAERCMQTDKIVSGEVVLTNMQKMSSPVIAEHTVAMILAMARALPQFINGMESGEWQRWDGSVASEMQSVQGRTLLVAGLGGIGTEVARRAAALGMRVVGTRRSSREGPDFIAYVGHSDELLTLAGEADFVVNALPLTDATQGLFDAEFFAALKAGAYFASIGRGGTTSTDALVAALESGRLAGAALDVTDPEPLPADHPLWQMPNVIITPHVAGRGTVPGRHHRLLRENLQRFVAGDALLNVVDPRAGY